jgi:hypothetical protein
MRTLASVEPATEDYDAARVMVDVFDKGLDFADALQERGK